MTKNYFLFSFFLIFTSCSTYYQKAFLFQKELQEGKTKEALESIDKIKILKSKKNKLLYLLEKGKLEYFNKNYLSSNEFFNKADLLIEDYRKNYGNEILSYFINPTIKPYLPQDFEKVLIHYYKSLNFFALNENEKALVEAKRINLKLQEINDKYPEGKKNSYTSDAFSLILQGLIYESLGEINNAFISYRNAWNLYDRNAGTYYGISAPIQLKKDLISTAHELGFFEERNKYEKLFGISHKSLKNSKEEVVLFWENGLGPIKEQTHYTFSFLPGKEVGIATIFNKELNLAIPLPLPSKRESAQFSDLEFFNVAFPKYKPRAPFYSSAKVILEKEEYFFEKVQNLNVLALQVFKDHTLREISQVAIRLATKKLSEHLLRNQNQNLGALLGIFNALSENADTRNWQSLPAEIYYTRIPIKKSQDKLKVNFYKGNDKWEEKEISLEAGEKNKKLKIYSIITLKELKR